MSKSEGQDPDYKYSNAAWHESLPVSPTQEQKEAAVMAAKEQSEIYRELSDRIHEAREEYYKIYEKDAAIWRLGFNDRFKYLLTRLEKKRIIFTEPEKVILRTALQNSTVTMKTLKPDYVDDPSKPDPLAGSPSNSKKVE